MPKSATIAKIVGYFAPIWLIADFFIASNAWDNVTWIIVIFSFFYLGAFFTFASGDSMIDFWRRTSRLGRALADPVKGNQAILTHRIIGFVFTVFTLYFAFSVFRYPISFSLTGR